MSKVKCFVCGEVVDADPENTYDFPEYLDALGITAIPNGCTIYDETVLHFVIHDDCMAEKLKLGLAEEIDE